MRPETRAELTGLRRACSEFIEGPRAVTVITILIVINAIILGFETDPGIRARHGVWLSVLDRAILLVFTLEIAIKLYAYRLNFFRSGWNIFDFLIVGLAWIPATGPLSVLRALRILRILRLLSIIPQLRRVISAIGHSIPGMLSVIGVLSLVFYVSAVLCTNLFGSHPDPRMQEWFGTVGASAYTLFQIMTLESWSMGIVRPTMELFPYAWIFFVPFIIVTSFAVLNLFIGIIVDAMQTSQEEPPPADNSAINDFTHAEIDALHKRLDGIQKEISTIAVAVRQRD